MLSVTGLQVSYAGSRVLQGVELSARPAEIVALLGRNGAGRSTMLKAVMGLVPGRGSVRWNGTELLGRRTHAIARLGVGYVPETRDVFPGLTVSENLGLGVKGTAWKRVGRSEAGGAAAGPHPPPSPADAGEGAWTEEQLLNLFPSLRARLHTPAGVLSGGEQQMLSLCRTLMGEPDLLLIDEPTEGLAPQVVEQVAHCLHRLRERGVAVVLAEQKLAIALQLAQRCVVLGHGRVVFEGSPAQLQAAQDVRREWLEV